MAPFINFGMIALATALALTAPAGAAPGDVDLGFNPMADNFVMATAVQPDGKMTFLSMRLRVTSP